VTPLGAHCSHVVSASAGFPRASPSSTFAPDFVNLAQPNVSPGTSGLAARVSPSMVFSISSGPNPPKWFETRASGRIPLTRTDDEHQNGASGSAKGQLKPLPTGVEPPTSERYSDPESVLGHDLLGTRSSRCSHDLFPLRGLLVSTVGLSPSPPVLAPLRPSTPEGALDRSFAALQGIDPVEPGYHSEEWFQPPWSLQPLPISENPRQSQANP
jgi:hypothetical protein